MRISLLQCLRVIAFVVLGSGISACSTSPQPSSSLPLGLSAIAPAGFVALCQRSPAECPNIANENDNAPKLINASYVQTRASAQVQLTSERWDQLNAINSQVNNRVRFESDEAQYGVEDYWTPAIDAGDCEDFALRKRDLLWESGWPTGSLGLALVQSRRTGEHAVLIANTSQGAFVLDNASAWILPWSDAGYTWEIAQDSTGRWRMAGQNAEAALLVAMGSSQQFPAARALPTAAPGGPAH